MSERERIKKAWEKVISGDIDNFDVTELMPDDSREGLRSYVKDWMIDRTNIKLYVTSLTYTFYNQYTADFSYNNGNDEHFKNVDKIARHYIDSIIQIIIPYCKKGIPFVENRVSTEYNMKDHMVLIQYRIAINKHDLNYLKIKQPELYHKISGYTIEKPMRIE